MVLFTTALTLSPKSVRPFLKDQFVNCMIYFFNLFTLKPPFLVICKIMFKTIQPCGFDNHYLCIETPRYITQHFIKSPES